MDQTEASTSVSLRVVSDALTIDSAHPMAFLRQMAGGPRGLWARGDEWVAHAGAAHVLRPHPEVGRFEWIRSQSDRIRDILGADAPAPRLFGGFAFPGQHEATGHWADFPAALFHLPEFELISQGQGALLRGFEVAREDERPDVARERLRGRLREVAEMLGAAPPATQAPKPVPCNHHAANPAEWRNEVEDALKAIHSGVVSKVVLARTLDIVSESPLDPLRVLDYMWRENRGAHVFMFEPSQGHVLVGAAPETVATVRDGAFHATAVAGSIARGETPEEQQSLAERLLHSEKDLVEHRIALDDMVEQVRPFAHEVRAAPRPHVLTLARIQHLETDIRARLHDGTHVLDVLEALHPTPAVCGLPRDAALEFLDREEPFDRGWYSGPVGWFDTSGNGIFAPALRCAVARGREWRLFAGAGIVGASDPALEWEETGIKFEPVLRALRASGAR